MSRSLTRLVAGGAAVVSAFALAGKALGFLQKLVMAYYFGTSGLADAFALAYNSLIAVISQFPPQVLAPFLPVYMSVRRERGEVAARQLAGTVGALLVLVLSAAVVGGFLMARPLVESLSQFPVAETRAAAIRLTRIMIPAVLFLGLIAFGTVLLHAEKRFSRPAFAETLSKGGSIVVLLLLGHWMGIDALGLGVLIGAALGFAVIAAGLRGRIVPSLAVRLIWRDPDLRRWVRLTGPILLGVLIAQIRTILDNRFASGMASGSVAALQYARGLNDTLVLLVPSAVGVVLYPVFSEMAEPAKRAMLGDTLLRSLRAMIVLLLPLSVILIALRQPIIQLLFQRGRFRADSVALTAWPLVFYGAGLPLFAVEILLMRLYYALKNTWAPTLVGAACVALHVGIILLTRDALQHGSMALAATLSKGVKVAILWIGLRAFLPSLQGRRTRRFAVQTALALAAMAGAVWLVSTLLHRLAWPGVVGGMAIPRALGLALEIGGASSVGLAAYLFVAWLVRLEELTLAAGWLVRRRKETR